MLGSIGRGLTVVAVLAVLGRLVDPQTMGLFGIGWAVSAVGFAVAQGGAAQGLIALPKVERGHVAAAQVLSLGLAALIALLAAVAAAVAHHLSLDPRLPGTLLLGGAFILPMSLASVDLALLQRDLRFSRLSAIQTGAGIVAAVTAIGLGLSGQGLIALFALQGLVGAWAFLAFRVSGIPMGLGRFERRHLTEIAGFGAHVSLGSITGVLWQNVPQIVVARLVSLDVLGQFVFATRLVQIVWTQLSGVINSVVYPSMSAVRGDRAAIGGLYLKTAKLTYVIVSLPLLGLAVAPDALLDLFGGAKWSQGGVFLFWLAVGQMVIALGAAVFPTFQAIGRPSVAWRWNLFITAVQTAAMLLVADRGGDQIVRAMAISAGVMPLAVWWLAREVSFGFSDYVRAMVPGVAAVAIATGVGSTVRAGLAGYGTVVILVGAIGAAVLCHAVLILATDGALRRAVVARATGRS